MTTSTTKSTLVQTSLSPVTPTTLGITRFCKTPSQPPNGHWKLHRSQCQSDQDCDIPEGMELQLGSHLVYSCNPGYKIRGSADVSCSLEGKWLNIPVCIGIKIIYFWEHIYAYKSTSCKFWRTHSDVLKF